MKTKFSINMVFDEWLANYFGLINKFLVITAENN